YTKDQGMITNGIYTATPQVSGLGKYYVQITDKFGCTALDSVSVGLLVQVAANNDTAQILVNTFADINVLANDAPREQLDPTTISVISPPANGTAVVTSDSMITYTPYQNFIGQDNFIYTVCDYYQHCDEATVLVMVNDESFFVPNAFSPNGDGINDYFHIAGLSQYDHVSFKVFSRWGNLVYESSNYGEGDGRTGFWNGRANRGGHAGGDVVPAGTYFYILNLGNGQQKITGFIYVNH
ncbi:MAG TPA: gliding motility-associated C-terminal domain-containing protein, partial [Sunxiuqinia sp.]|nr:gliding motility-associated C-terminal domain-containing protein [Sunxiuqinia sp.]